MQSGIFINYNGTIQDQNDLLFSVQNRAFRYGDGLFETMRMINGKIQFITEHSNRLAMGMSAMKFKVHSSFNSEFIESEIIALARRNQIFKDARIRFSVFRSDGGFYAPLNTNYNYLIEINPLETEGYTWNKKGLIIDIYTEARKDYGYLSSYKTMNSIPYVLSGIRAQELNVDECLILNSKSNIVESTSCNLFMVYRNIIYTPNLNEGCIKGVMRKNVLRIATELGILFEETIITEQALKVADEIFLTNSSKGIQWVVGFRNKRFFSKVSKSIHDELIKN